MQLYPEKIMRIYVGNLAAHTTKNEIRKTFEPYGQVSRVAIAMDKQSGLPRGFGIVEMAQDEDGKRAIAEIHGTQLDNRTLRVKEARPRKERNGQHRNRADKNGA